MQLQKLQTSLKLLTKIKSFDTSKTASWRFHQHLSISGNSALLKSHPGFSSSDPGMFLFMKKKFFSSSNAAHMKQLNDLSCGPRVLSRNVKFPVSTQQRSRFNDPWLALLESWRSSWWFPSADKILVGLLVATNVAVHILWKIADPIFMKKNFMISVENFASGRVHTLITHAFSHIDEGHLFNNMLSLYLFGTSIGQRFGPQFLVQLYLAGAVGSSIFFIIRHMFMAPHSRGSGIYVDPKKVSGLGASGAVNAIMLLHIFLNPRTTYRYYHVIPVPGLILGAFFIGQDIWRTIKKDGRISGEGHLGGAFVAALAWARITKRWI